MRQYLEACGVDLEQLLELLNSMGRLPDEDDSLELLEIEDGEKQITITVE